MGHASQPLLFRLRQRPGLCLGAVALLMLGLFPFVSLELAGLFNIGLVVVANIIGFWRWGLVATAFTIIITWVMDVLFWQAGLGWPAFMVGGLFNLGLTLTFGIVLERRTHDSIRDALTGLCNRGHFLTMLGWEVNRAERYGRPLSLLLIDLDGFKAINDRHGHLEGDAILARFGQLLADIARVTDLPARYGGDEFAVVLPETDQAGAAIMAERIKRRVEAADWLADGRAIAIGASIGVATHRQGDSAEQLIKAADRSLYRYKHNPPPPTPN